MLAGSFGLLFSLSAAFYIMILGVYLAVSINANMLRFLSLSLSLSLFPFSSQISAQPLRIEPSNWWIGMQEPTVQLLVHGDGVGEWRPTVEYPGVRIVSTHEADSPNYLFIDLAIASNTLPGSFPISFYYGREEKATYRYELRAREKAAEDYVGFDAGDVIYLVTPDRFANGDPSNDIVATQRETTIDRRAGFARHGGDLAGITAHLDYLEDMGFTAIWPSPVLDNNMPRWSYHGYAITDYYGVDPRFGSLADYRELADEARACGIKLIMDQVVNHCGSGHWWMEDLPFGDWLNYQDSLRVTNHRRTVHQDPYAARVDAELMTGGWFVPTMPDLNQHNPYMANYLIQNSIWWIETLGLGGVRQDTYPYPDKDFLTDWTCRIQSEYPNFTIVGEEWSNNPLVVAYWQAGKENPDGYQSCLKSVMDFPIQEKLIAALNEPETWGTGLVKLYEALSNDHVYAHPKDIMVFGDNHDMDRLFTQLDGDVAKMKLALTYLLTIRGIPQLYYGTEVLLQNDRAPGDHGIIRTDFPGGWAGDTVNGFTGEGLSKEQDDVQQFVKKILNWRKDNPTVARGNTIHFGPRDGIYIYGRYTNTGRIMVVLNKNASMASLPLDRYEELLRDSAGGKDILTDKRYQWDEGLSIPAESAMVLEIF